MMFGAMIAPPAPCARRAAIRKPGSGATAHSADASTNAASPTQKHRLRP